MKYFVHLVFLLFVMNLPTTAQHIPKFDLQGHRGARGLKPENSIPAFITALNYGVTTLELDVVITKDKQVVVSHEPWMSSEVCLLPDGSPIQRTEEMSYNIYELTYDEVKQFDCGSKGNERFSEQEKMAAVKPLLKSVIISVEDHIKSYTQYEVDYNIEIKSRKEGDGKYHPSPEEFSELVYNLVDQYLPWERVVIQSFDLRVLKYWNAKCPNVRLAFLVENTKSPQKNLEELGFIPSAYSPYFKLLKKEHIDYLRTLKPSIKSTTPLVAGTSTPTVRLRIIPWTVNETEDMKRMRDLGVDGLITDYPNRAAELGMGIRRNGNNQTNGSHRK
jgi:glycerophosphoryl diester phosphodiesterase